MGKKNEFEQIFHDFVSWFGGEVLPEPSDTKIADYLFRKQNVVAELKCLMEDQTSAMNKKLTQVVQDWWRKHKKIPAGYDSSKPLEISTAPKEIADCWMEILKAPIEGFIRHANQQIRDTKQRLNIADAKGLVLIFNQGNLLHNRPPDFTKLMTVDTNPARASVKSTCHSPAMGTDLHVPISPKPPSVALYLVESTFQRGFDSFRAHHLFNCMKVAPIFRRHGARQRATTIPATLLHFCVCPTLSA